MNNKFEDWTTAELAEYLLDREVYDSFENALMTDRCDLIEECYNYLNSDSPEAFIQRGRTSKLFVKRDIEMSSITLTMLRVCMEAWSVWAVSIEPDKYFGWEFPEEITPELINQAYKKIMGKECKIID